MAVAVAWDILVCLSGLSGGSVLAESLKMSEPSGEMNVLLSSGVRRGLARKMKKCRCEVQSLDTIVRSLFEERPRQSVDVEIVFEGLL